MTGAVIVGARGQDGRLLGEQLERAGRTFLGLGRGDIDLLDRAQVDALIGEHRPLEVYYLAAHHHAAEEAAGGDEAGLFRVSFDVHVTGLIHFLEAIRLRSPATRLFYAASSHVFGQGGEGTQDERTPFDPLCVYGITKAAGLRCCRYYRRAHGVFAAAGILYNHESRYRSPKFVSQKIVRGALAIKAGSQDRLVLGDLSARIDWGYAPDFVDAMQRVLALPEAGDFVVATGESHSVQEFVEAAFAAVGLDWRRHVSEDAGRVAMRRRNLTGNAARLRGATGWKPTVSFAQMVHLLLESQRHGR